MKNIRPAKKKNYTFLSLIFVVTSSSTKGQQKFIKTKPENKIYNKLSRKASNATLSTWFTVIGSIFVSMATCLS